MAEGIPKKEEEKKPADAGKNESKSESKDEEFREKAHNLINYVANWRRRRKLEREGKKVPTGEKKETSEKEKKEAAGALSTMGFGTAALGGFIALVFAGVVYGAQKFSAWSKSFDAGFKLAYPGGGKGAGGKKEKA